MSYNLIIVNYNFNAEGVEDETETEMLKSILAQLEFTYTIRQYDQNGIPFRTQLYVPEVHPNTGEVFMEREDEGHVLKVGVVPSNGSLMVAN